MPPPVDEARFDKVSTRLERDVEQYTTDALQEWMTAANGALTAATLPQEDDSILYWIVSLAANMIWAATVFMAPGPGGLPSTRQKVATVVGAGFAPDTAKQLRKLWASAPHPDRAKEFFGSIVAMRADQWEQTLVDEIYRWVREDFTDHLIRRMKERWWKNQHKPGTTLTPQLERAREKWAYDEIENMRGSDLNENRHYVYENFVFPRMLEYRDKSQLRKNLRETLLSEMKDQVAKALTDYKTQYDRWRRLVDHQARIDDSKRLAPGSPARPPLELRVPFEPRLKFAGKDLSDDGTNYSPGQVVRIWKFGKDKA